MRFDNLDDWLAWQETLNPKQIDLGLERLQQVMRQGAIADRFDCPLIIVAGTNGKGSTIAFIEAIAAAAGYRVCCYTSPHIRRYNERIRIAGEDIGDGALCEAFERVDTARADVPLTYFEFGTLAAIDLFQRAVRAGDADLVVMEIGLGGRLDAVNVMQPDVSIITGIALDHTDWLGETIADIAREKAGVMRRGITTVVGDCDVPDSLYEVADGVGARTLTLDRDVFIASTDGDWSMMAGEQQLQGLPLPSLPGEHQLHNAACAISALLQLSDRLAIGREALGVGLVSANVAGRMQLMLLADGTPVLLDVAHNPQAMAALVDWCRRHPVAGGDHLVLAMLRDKPVTEMVSALCPLASSWHISGLDGVSRGLPAAGLAEVIGERCGDVKLAMCDGVEQACASALRSVTAAGAGRIIVTGSFYTVAAASAYFEHRQ